MVYALQCFGKHMQGDTMTGLTTALIIGVLFFDILLVGASGFLNWLKSNEEKQRLLEALASQSMRQLTVRKAISSQKESAKQRAA